MPSFPFGLSTVIAFSCGGGPDLAKCLRETRNPHQIRADGRVPHADARLQLT